MLRLYSTFTSKRTISIMGKLFSENSEDKSDVEKKVKGKE